MTRLRQGVVRVDRQVIDGINAWLVGDDQECVLIDAPADAAAILEAVGDRRLLGILCTHAHAEHIAAALTVADAARAAVHLHADDYALWHQTFPGLWPTRMLVDGMTFDVAGVRLLGLHVPGHTPGGMCWYASQLGALFSGDSLDADGPCRGPRPASDYDGLVSAIRARLFTLPPDTVVHPGHGVDGRIGHLRWKPEFWS